MDITNRPTRRKPFPTRGMRMSKRVHKVRDNQQRWENIRRLRYGAFIRLFQSRYGTELPDDDAGQEDIWLLVQNVSMAVSGAEKKMRHVIEIWAPWMKQEDAEAMMEFASRLPHFEKCPTSEELGQRLRVTNAERNALKLWPFKPMDISADELEAQRKARINERRRMRARANGVRSREAYLAELRSRPKPWDAEGVSQRQWQRRQNKICREVVHDMSRGTARIIVIKHRRNLTTSSQAERPRSGFHEGVNPERPRTQATELGEVETNASSSSRLRPNLATSDPLMAALEKLGRRRTAGTHE